MADKYLILDSRGNAVAHGVSDYRPQGGEWRMVIDDGDVDEIAKHTFICLVGDSDAVPAMEGKIIRREGRVIVLEPVRPLEKKVRENLRIPVAFSSFIYPCSGAWKGRESIESRDLSCGGLAFWCPRALEIGEQVQTVIPITAQPLLLYMEILRRTREEDGRWLYAARFLELLREEESMVREAVFGLQLKRN